MRSQLSKKKKEKEIEMLSWESVRVEGKRKRGKVRKRERD